MSHITIKKIDSDGVSGELHFENYNIPILFSGRAMALLEKDNKDPKFAGSTIINPDIINVYRKDVLQYPMTDVKISSLLGKTVLEGNNGYRGYEYCGISLDNIKLLWSDKYSSDFQEWNIELR